MKIRSFAHKGLACAAVLFAALDATASLAAQISLTTSGVDSGLDSVLDELLPDVSPVVLGADNFFTVSFDQGGADEFVESILLDLSADDDAVFDNQDFFAFSAAPEVGSSSGLAASDISFSAVSRADFDNPSPTRILQISFAPGSFGVGDFFSFGVDTNGVGDDVVAQFSSLSSFTNDAIETFNDTGADFGNSLARFAVSLEDGSSTTAGFDAVDTYRSIARAVIEPMGLEMRPLDSAEAVAIAPGPAEADRSAGPLPEVALASSSGRLLELLAADAPTSRRPTAVPEPNAVASFVSLFLFLSSRLALKRSASNG